MEKAVTGSNGVTRRGNIIKETVVDFLNVPGLSMSSAFFKFKLLLSLIALDQ